MVVALLILALPYQLWRGVHILLMTFAGMFFAVFLSTLSAGLSRHTGIPYG
jgi:hypothetical protein